MPKTRTESQDPTAHTDKEGILYHVKMTKFGTRNQFGVIWGKLWFIPMETMSILPQALDRLTQVVSWYHSAPSHCLC